MIYLFDTNIFLEILLAQEKASECKRILVDHSGNIAISDFSLHSIGVILFKYDKENLFNGFISDVMPKVKLVSLSSRSYNKLSEVKKNFNLDFDDAYQYQTARENGLTIVTMDGDFKRARDVKVNFI